MRHGLETIAVLDVGKTNLKVLIASADGEPIESRSCANDWKTGKSYLAIDIGAVEQWFIAQLSELSPQFRINAIITTGHGCGAVLVDDIGPVLPMMDYESPSPSWLDEIYAEQAPAYNEVYSDIGSGAMRLAKQLIWQAQECPSEFARASHYLMTPQFIAWRLGGRPATEISLLAAQTHLWAPASQRFAGIVFRHNWTRLFPAFAKAGEVLGHVSSIVAKKTGLRSTTKILCGVHDSNANLFRYRAAGRLNDSVVSTGTWMIGFNRQMPLTRMDRRRAMVANVSVDGESVASTLTMTGREFSILAEDAMASDAEVIDAIPTLLSQGTSALPSFVADDGLVPGSALRGKIIGPLPKTPAERRALATLYCAFTADACLSALESNSSIVVDGGFAANLPFGQLLAALRPNQSVLMSQSRDGTALGAALLWRRVERTEPVSSVTLDSVSPIHIPKLVATAQGWICQMPLRTGEENG